MRNLPASISADIATGASHLVGCWHITRTDGEVLRSTESDHDITIASGDYAGTYTSTTSITGSGVASKDDLSVDNMEASGTLDADFVINGIRAQDIEAGLLDAARAVYFLVNWQDPDGGQVILRYGTLGNVQRDSTGRWTCELRGLTQRFAQAVGLSYALSCSAKFGDARCGKHRDDFLFTGSVASAASARLFDVTLDDLGSPAFPVVRFVGGELRFDTGLNAGYSKEVKAFDGTTLEVWEAFPFSVQPTDTFSLWADCGKSRDDCVFYDNIVNFRGFPDMPGPDTLAQLRSGPSKAGRKSGGGK